MTCHNFTPVARGLFCVPQPQNTQTYSHHTKVSRKNHKTRRTYCTGLFVLTDLDAHYGAVTSSHGRTSRVASSSSWSLSIHVSKTFRIGSSIQHGDAVPLGSEA